MKLSGDKNQCPSCGLFFNSTHAFDKHRTGPFNARQCLTKEQMASKGMELNAKGFWLGESMKDDRWFQRTP